MVQKVRTNKFKKFNVKIFIYIRYTPRLYLILKLSANSFITNTLDTVKLFKKKKFAKGVVNHIMYGGGGGVHQFMLSTTRDQYHSENPLKKINYNINRVA